MVKADHENRLFCFSGKGEESEVIKYTQIFLELGICLYQWPLCEYIMY